MLQWLRFHPAPGPAAAPFAKVCMV
jgi:hypothetical protein